MTLITDTKKRGGRPVRVEAVKAVKQLKDEGGLSFREIQQVLTKRYGKPVDVKTIYRWYSY